MENVLVKVAYHQCVYQMMMMMMTHYIAIASALDVIASVLESLLQVKDSCKRLAFLLRGCEQCMLTFGLEALPQNNLLYSHHSLCHLMMTVV